MHPAPDVTLEVCLLILQIALRCGQGGRSLAWCAKMFWKHGSCTNERDSFLTCSRGLFMLARDLNPTASSLAYVCAPTETGVFAHIPLCRKAHWAVSVPSSVRA